MYCCYSAHFMKLIEGPLTKNFCVLHIQSVDSGSTVVKLLCYKSEGRWFEPSWCQWIFN